VGAAQDQLIEIWERTGGDDGYVSFELDPLLEDPDLGPPHEERVRRYIELAKTWGHGHENRMIKVPATRAGLEALEDIAALGVIINVTLLFTQEQYEAAREAIWRGRQRYGSLDTFKSVYSIFVSRVDVYTQEHVPQLSSAAQGMVGLANAKRLWRLNAEFWTDKNLPLKQEFIFASTGAKMDWQDEDYYVRQLAGSDIQTNPPKTNDALAAKEATFGHSLGELPDEAILQEIHEKVDLSAMQDVLMDEGVRKFADPFKKLLASIASKREQLTA
jgi:transaldolase